METMMFIEAHLDIETPPKMHEGGGSGAGKAVKGNVANHKVQKAMMKPKSLQSLGNKVKGMATAARPGSVSPNPRKCFKCEDPSHGLFQCLYTTEAEAKELYDKSVKGKKGKTTKADAVASKHDDEVSFNDDPSIVCWVNDAVETRVTPDSGADKSVVSQSLIDHFEQAGCWLQVKRLARPWEIQGVDGHRTMIQNEVKLTLAFDTPSGRLVLNNVECWIAARPLPSGVGEVLLGRSVMLRLGYNLTLLLDTARQQSQEYGMGGSFGPLPDLAQGYWQSPLTCATPTDECAVAHEELSLNDDEDTACFPSASSAAVGDFKWEEAWQVLKSKLEEAEREGCSAGALLKLESILWTYCDVFRIKLGCDAPVRAPPMEVTLKPGATPVRCKAR